VAGVSLDDGGWGSIATNFANALAPDPNKRAQLYLAGAHYNKTLQEIEEQRLKMDAVKGAVDAYPDTVPTFPEGPVNAERQAILDAQRRKAIAYQAATARLAKSASDFAQGVPAIEGQNTIAAGIPTDPRKQDVAQAQLSTIGGSLPNYAATPHTYQPTDAAGTAVGAPITSRRMPDGPAQLMSPKSAEQKSFGDENFRLDKIKTAIDRVETAGPGSMTEQQLRDTELAIVTQWPRSQKETSDARGNKVIIGYEEKMVPRAVGKVLAEINTRLYGAPSSAPPSIAPPAVGAAPPPATVGGGVARAPDALAGAPAAPGAAPPAAAAAAPPAPIIPPGAIPATAGAPGSGPQITQIPGGGAPATHEAANTTRQVVLAGQARAQLQSKIGYDENTGQLKPNYYVPGFGATVVGEKYGGSAGGRRVVKWLDPKAQEYRAEAMRWIEPVLRNASGAAIRPEEYGDYFAMFIPETGDTPREVTRKLQAMKAWENATSGAATANQALATMDRIAQQTGDVTMRQAADRIRVVARERGTLDTPLVGDPAAAAGAGAPAGAPSQGPPPVDHNAVNDLLRKHGLR
jgi:hypothetical protein